MHFHVLWHKNSFAYREGFFTSVKDCSWGVKVRCWIYIFTSTHLFTRFLAFIFYFWENTWYTAVIIHFGNPISGSDSSSSLLGINGGRVISMSRKKLHDWTEREMYATYGTLDFINWEECKVSFWEVQSKNTGSPTNVLVQLLVQEGLQMLMSSSVVGDLCWALDSFLDFSQSIKRYFSLSWPPCFNCITMTRHHC